MNIGKRSLSSKLIVGFISMGMIPLIVLSVLLYRSTHQINKNTEAEYHTYANIVLDKIERNLFERYGDVQAFASNDVIQDKANWYLIGSDSNKIARAANRYVSLYGIYDLCLVVDLEGKLIAANDRNAGGDAVDTTALYERNFSGESWFKKTVAEEYLSSDLLDGTYVEDMHLDEDAKSVHGTSGYVITYSALIRDADGNAIGVWHNKATFSVVEEIIQTSYAELRNKGMASAEITLLDKDGFVIFDYDPAVHDGDTGVRHDPTVLKKLNLADQGVDSARQLVEGKSGGNRSFHERKKIWQTTGFSKSAGALGYPGVGWGLLLRVSEAESLRLSGSIITSTLWIAGGALAGLLLVSWWLGHSISRPILSRINVLENTGNRVAHAAKQISEASQSFADGASEQAASLEETSASLEEMSSMTRRNAESAKEAMTLTSNTRASAESGSKDVDEMKTAMADIKESSDSIARILKSIDEIAFQTNILALNAAVEAARAGEAGMGFAVVAEEVRNLAQRSAAAARETSEGIETAINRSERGVVACEKVAKQFSEIARQAHDVDELVGQIASACQEQSQGIAQVNIAVTDMDRQTQGNAGTAEETASASVELKEQSHAVRSCVMELRELVAGSMGKTKTESIEAAVSNDESKRYGGMKLTQTRESEAFQRAGSRQVDLVTNA